MARLWIKICGMTTPAMLEAAAAAGADAAGFVFHAASPRNVDPRSARELRDALPAGLECVAVFLHPSQALVDSVSEAMSPDWFQMDTADVERLRLPGGARILHVLRRGAALPSTLPQRCLAEGAVSGAGERADWALAARLARTTQLVLAGGLDARNVAEAVRTVRPFGVDVSSGVESSRGVKDAARIREFVKAARASERTGAD